MNAAQQAAVAAAKQRLGARLALSSWSGQARTESCNWDTVLPTWNCDPPLRGGVGMDYLSSAGDRPSARPGSTSEARPTLSGT